jgi:glycosyltransferase involved in cell wall biosynthesis
MGKPRILYVVHHFPQISETYIRSEIEALSDEYDIRVVSLNQANYPYKTHAPYQVTDDPATIEAAIAEFQPNVLHTHWLEMARVVAYFAGFFPSNRGRPNIPFTIRTHSFDVLEQKGQLIEDSAALVNSDLCLGILAFPFARPLLEQGGVRPEKIHDCYPVVNYPRFLDRSPNGKGVMNVGACLPKKQMADFLELACAFPDRPFDLYALGYQTPEITRLNESRGDPVRIIPPVEPEDMRAEYKKHEWLVYTASRDMNSVGWPMAVAEAQAAGVGVCLPNIRPDLNEYVGGAGFLYNSVSEVAEILRKPFPDEMRQMGFEQAKKSDIVRHKTILTDLWQGAGAPRSSRPAFVASVHDSVAAWGEGGTALEKRLRIRQVAQELTAAIPPGRNFALVDEGALIDHIPPDRRATPFPDRDGQYCGPPADDTSAIEELERQRLSGTEFLVFAWPAFWWLDHYAGFGRYLRENSRHVLESDRLIVFDLRPKP